MSLPPSQSRKIPEGAYTFTVSEAPTKKRHNSGMENEFATVVFLFRVDDNVGNTYKHRESLIPWNPVYQDILVALGGELDDKGNAHLGDSEEALVGRSFGAEIVHEPDKDNPEKTWARIANIEPPEGREEEDVPMPNGNSEESGEPEDEEPLPF